MLPHYNWSKNFAWNPKLSRWGEYSFEQILVCMGTSYKRFLISPFVLDPILMANDSIKKGTGVARLEVAQLWNFHERGYISESGGQRLY